MLYYSAFLRVNRADFCVLYEFHRAMPATAIPGGQTAGENIFWRKHKFYKE
jgi:hypothetical protein